MEPKLLKAIIENVFIEVCQEMLFLDVIPMVSTDDDEEGIIHAYKMNILMPYMGFCIVVFPDIVARRVVENIQGEGSSDDLEILNDTIAEYLNVLLGRIFEESAPSLLFELGLPSKIDFSKQKLGKHSRLDFKTPCDSKIIFYHNFKLE